MITTPIKGIKIPKSAVQLTDAQMKDIVVKITDRGCTNEPAESTQKPKWKMKPVETDE